MGNGARLNGIYLRLGYIGLFGVLFSGKVVATECLDYPKLLKKIKRSSQILQTQFVDMDRTGQTGFVGSGYLSRARSQHQWAKRGSAPGMVDHGFLPDRAVLRKSGRDCRSLTLYASPDSPACIGHICFKERATFEVLPSEQKQTTRQKRARIRLRAKQIDGKSQDSELAPTLEVLYGLNYTHEFLQIKGSKSQKVKYSCGGKEYYEVHPIRYENKTYWGGGVNYASVPVETVLGSGFSGQLDQDSFCQKVGQGEVPFANHRNGHAVVQAWNPTPTSEFDRISEGLNALHDGYVQDVRRLDRAIEARKKKEANAESADSAEPIAIRAPD